MISWVPDHHVKLLNAWRRSGVLLLLLGGKAVETQDRLFPAVSSLLASQPKHTDVHDRWAGGAGLAARLLTLSYDGSLRCLDPGAGCAFQVRQHRYSLQTKKFSAHIGERGIAAQPGPGASCAFRVPLCLPCLGFPGLHPCLLCFGCSHSRETGATTICPLLQLPAV